MGTLGAVYKIGSDSYVNYTPPAGYKGLASFNGWIRQSVRENKPLDRMARELAAVEKVTRDDAVAKVTASLASKKQAAAAA